MGYNKPKNEHLFETIENKSYSLFLNQSNIEG